MLYVKMPLLDIRPYGFVRDRNHRQRRSCACWLGSDTGVAYFVGHGSGLHCGTCGRFQRFGSGFVAVGMFEENSVASANGCLPTAGRVPGEADARCRIEQMAFHTTVRDTFRDAALHDPVESISNNQIGRW